MRNIKIILIREFLYQISNKSFIFITLLYPLLFVLSSIVLNEFNLKNDKIRIKVIDKSGFFRKDFTKPTDNIIYYYTTNDDINNVKSNRIYNGELLINKYPNLNYNIDLTLNESLNKYLKLYLIDNIKIKILSNNVYNKLNILNFKIHNNVLNSTIDLYLSIFSCNIVFMFIVIYGIKIMRSVTEEKNSKVIEMIMTSSSPLNILAGKILGTCLVAFIQFLLINILVGVLLYILNVDKFFLSLDEIFLKNIAKSFFNIRYLILNFITLLYLILGYLIYSTIFASIGCVVNNNSDTQQYTIIPVILLSIGGYGAISYYNSQTFILKVLSYIPFTSPITNVAKIYINFNIIENIISISILLVSIVIFLYISSILYKKFILGR